MEIKRKAKFINDSIIYELLLARSMAHVKAFTTFPRKTFQLNNSLRILHKFKCSNEHHNRSERAQLQFSDPKRFLIVLLAG